MQYMIFLSDGKEENCVLITGLKSNAIKRLKDFKDVIKREHAWFELREYENNLSRDYVVIENSMKTGG